MRDQAEFDPGLSTWTRGAFASASALPGVVRVGLALVEGGGRRLSFTASDRAGAGGPEWCFVDAYDDVPLNVAVRHGRSVLGDWDALRGRYPTFVGRQDASSTTALAAIPITASGQTLGGCVLFFDAPQRFGPDERRRLADLGRELGEDLRRTQQRLHRAASPFASDDAPAGALMATHHVAPDPAAVRSARTFLHSTLSTWNIAGDVADAAVLCLSELVTNAVIHTRAGCAVRTLLDRGVLTTSVRDLGRGDHTTRTAPTTDPLKVHGRGLQIVEALATRWGSTLDTEGTTVWFVFDL